MIWSILLHYYFGLLGFSFHTFMSFMICSITSREMLSFFSCLARMWLCILGTSVIYKKSLILISVIKIQTRIVLLGFVDVYYTLYSIYFNGSNKSFSTTSIVFSFQHIFIILSCPVSLITCFYFHRIQFNVVISLKEKIQSNRYSTHVILYFLRV